MDNENKPNKREGGMEPFINTNPTAWIALLFILPPILPAILITIFLLRGGTEIIIYSLGVLALMTSIVIGRYARVYKASVKDLWKGILIAVSFYGVLAHILKRISGWVDVWVFHRFLFEILFVMIPLLIILGVGAFISFAFQAKNPRELSGSTYLKSKKILKLLLVIIGTLFVLDIGWGFTSLFSPQISLSYCTLAGTDTNSSTHGVCQDAVSERFINNKSFENWQECRDSLPPYTNSFSYMVLARSTSYRCVRSVAHSKKNPSYCQNIIDGSLTDTDLGIVSATEYMTASKEDIIDAKKDLHYYCVLSVTDPFYLYN